MNTIKVVINTDFGGFNLSDEAIREYAKQKNIVLVESKKSKFGFTDFYVNEISDDNYFSDRGLDRSDADLVKVVETLGIAANGKYSSLKVVEIPEDANWYIEEFDGREHIAERHRVWD